jgi:Uma2 family endonuclease
MPGEAATVLATTYGDYLELERATDTRHEFYDGQAWAMAGGTPTHSAVKSNITRALGNALEKSPCREYDSDLKVLVEATGLATYPDATVICGPRQRSARDANAIINPILLVEVLSPSTRDWDTGGKFAHYRRIPTLREALFVSPEDRTVMHHWRNDDGTWQMRDVTQPTPIVLRSIEATLTFEQIFDRVFDRIEDPSDETQ